MKNILCTPISLAEITTSLQAHRCVKLLPPHDSPRWTTALTKPAVQQWLEPAYALARQERGQPMPELTDELYADFHKTGGRLPFEKIYFDRRRRVARAALLALQEPADWTSLRAVLAEESWTLPAHTVNKSGKEPGQIDLFAAETANLMGEILTIFEPVLPTDLKTEIKTRLHRIFQCYLAHDFGWMTSRANWNAVCHQGVLGAALAVEADDALVAQMLLRAVKPLQTFLNSFTHDGGCSEGPGYWGYGFGWFCELNQQLETRTGGELSLVEGDPHILKIEKYGPRMLLASGWMIPFADCGTKAAFSPQLLTYLAERFADDTARKLAQMSFQMLARDGFDVHDFRADFFSWTRLLLRCPADLGTPVQFRGEDVYLPDLGVLVAHGHRTEFAAKAGHNNEEHNHNDCGSFIFAVAGESLIMEIGAPEYVKDFFGPRRYEFNAARSRGHSLPVINGCEQPAGREYAARVLQQEITKITARFVVDLTACYPPAAGCTRYIRSFNYDKTQDRLEIEDRFDLTKTESLETALITPPDQQPVIEPDADTILTGTEWLDYRDHCTAQPRQVRRIVLRPRQLQQQVAMRYVIRAPAQS